MSEYLTLYELCSDTLAEQEGDKNKVRPQPHVEMCTFIEDMMPIHENRDTQLKGMLLVPRGCLKTTIGSVASAIKYLIHNPNGRVLIYSHTHDYAKDILRAIKGHLETNPKFRNLYGDWVPKAKSSAAARWSEDAIIITKRTATLKEPSIDTAGVDKPKTGGHYDYIIADDIVTEKTIDSPKIQRNIKRQLQTLYPILEPHGTLLMIGTRWASNDVYGHIIKIDADAQRKENEMARREERDPRNVEQFRKLIRGAYNDDHTLYCPQTLSAEFLAEAKATMEDRMFANWYLNQPIEEGSKVFHKAYIKYFQGEYAHGVMPVIEALVAA